MGCCSSQGAEKGAPQARTPFDTRPAETVQDVVWQARCQGPKTVHVTGRVVHTGSVFEAPFSGRHCVMVNVLVFLSGGQQPQQRTKPQPIYSGCNHLGFKIISTIDGRTQEIIIEPGVWEMHFERSSTFTNVRLDTQREMLVYKGTDSRTFQDLPKGKDFWDRFVHVTGPTKVDVPPVKDKSFKADLAKAQQARQLYQEMVASGVKPTSITLSVLIRVLERCRLLQEAIALLETEPLAHGIAVEARVYLQLLRAHLRERQGRYATRLYKMMLMRSSPTDDMTADILDCCAKMHLPETLADIVDIAREAGVRFNPKAAEAISRSSTRKQRPQQQPLQPQQQQP